MKLKNILIYSLTVITALTIFTGCSKNDSPNNKTDNTVSEKSKLPKYEGNLELLTDVSWVKKNSKDIVILDSRGKEDYNSGHIPNAINVAWQQFAKVNDLKPGDKNWGNLLPPKEISKVISNLGIEKDKIVVIYGNPPEGWGDDGRVAWSLLSANVKDVKILNGGWNSWKSSSNKISKDKPKPKSTKFSTDSLDDSLVIDTKTLSENLDSYKIIDSREASEYKGSIEHKEARGGHIPKAHSITWSNFLNKNGTTKTQKEIDDLMSKNNISKKDTIVTYCTGGIRSAHMSLILQMAGYNSINYDSSIYEWSANKSLPLE